MELFTYPLDRTLLSIRRGKTAKEPVCIALGIKPNGRREILGFWLFGADGESARNWREVLKDLKRAGSKGCGSSSPMIFAGWRRRSRGSFPKRREPLCPPGRAGCAEQGAEEEPGCCG
jgi:transposase-like protein